MSDRPRRGKRRDAPLSIRLSGAERSFLTAWAGQQPLSTYVKSVLFGSEGRAVYRPDIDRQAVAQVLAMLGKSGLADSLARLARQAEAGTLYCDASLHAQLCNACSDVAALRALLMRALGKDTAPPAGDAFRRAGGPLQ